MTELMRKMVEDPEAVFELEIELESGNTLAGTIGPMMGASVCAQLRFTDSPSAGDIEQAKAALDCAVGFGASMSLIASTPEEWKAAHVEMRRFLGGGQG